MFDHVKQLFGHDFGDSNSPSTAYAMPNVLEMSRKTPLTSTVGLLSKAVCISCIIESNWATHEYPGRKSSLESVKSLDYHFK